MLLSLIVAHGKNLEIGFENHMLWKIPSEFKHFKETTWGHLLLMGRKTFESILEFRGSPLPGRTTVVLSRQKSLTLPKGVLKAHSFEQALALGQKAKATKAFICGGQKIYEQGIDLASEMVISEVDYAGKADAYFPRYRDGDWETISERDYPATQSASELAWSLKIKHKKKGELP